MDYDNRIKMSEEQKKKEEEMFQNFLNTLLPKKTETKFYCFNCGAKLFERGGGFIECHECKSVFIPAEKEI